VSWETQRGRRVYYRAKKVAGKVVRSYAGSGLIGEQAAQEDARLRAIRETEQQGRNDIRRRWNEFDIAVRDASNSVELLFRADLIAAGYHQHAHGAWRHKRT
jgi:hypothetical protein